MNTFRAGIDIGSTTVKPAVLFERNHILFSAYRCHGAHTQETLCALLQEAEAALGSRS